MSRRIPCNSRGHLGAALALAAALGIVCPLRAASDRKLTFNADIRPILSENCLACHGPDKTGREGKFRLDDRDAAIAKKAIVPGNPGASLLIQKIFAADPQKRMPPPKSHKVLTEAQKQTLKQWIAQGAEYEVFWAYVDPQRWPAPKVTAAKWVVNPIDAFVLRKLEDAHVMPSPQADKRTLLRRLSLDLIGLPPTPREMQAFLDDQSADAYEKQVDRLLASPHYGERMAVPWLDSVRFADTVGYHGDQNQNVFPYRDYVINAFNSDEPFDQFTIQQLAGDLLPHPTMQDLVATCYNRLNMMTREGGAQAKEYLAKYAADRVRTLSSTWLGATMNCCECHDHKYDPFSAKDFYSMEAFWADVKQWGVYTTYKYTPNPDLKGFTNDYPFPPEIVVDSPYLQKRQAKILGQIDHLAAAYAQAHAADAARWRGATAAFLKLHPSGWTVLTPTQLTTSPAAKTSRGKRRAAAKSTSVKSQTAKVAAAQSPAEQTVPVAEDGSLSLDAAKGTARIQFKLAAGARVASIRLEALPDEHKGGDILRGAADSATVELSASIKAGGRAKSVAIFYADADFKEERYSNGYAILGVAGGWKTSAAHVKQKQTAVYVLAEPMTAHEGDALIVTLANNPLARVRVSISPVASLRPIDPALADSLSQAMASGATDAPVAARTFLMSEGDAKSLGQVRSLENDYYACRDGKSPVMVTVAAEPRITRLLRRGNWQDEGGPILEPATPEFLPHVEHPTGPRLTRLDLAHWLVSPRNPLTSRAVVNRLWKQFFGQGICPSVQDLGAQGEMPTHPHLLDWLAVEFRDPTYVEPGDHQSAAHAWDVKHVVKLMVMSSAYRQASNIRPELRESDPRDLLLASQTPRRLAAEFVRDNALAAAGLLNLDDIGGPSIFPYQPAGYYSTIQFPSRKYIPNDDDRQYRRGVYIHWQRSFLHPMLSNFDAPTREEGVCTRTVSNTPQQALTLLNDPTFVEAARVLAEKSAAAAPDDAGRLAFIFQRVLCRPPTDAERASLLKFLVEQRGNYAAHPEDAQKLMSVGITPAPAGPRDVELSAWATVCRVVMNLHESITRY